MAIKALTWTTTEYSSAIELAGDRPALFKFPAMEATTVGCQVEVSLDRGASWFPLLIDDLHAGPPAAETVTIPCNASTPQCVTWPSGLGVFAGCPTIRLRAVNNVPAAVNQSGQVAYVVLVEWR